MRLLRYRQPALVLLLFLSVAGSLSYFHVTRHDLADPATGGRDGDVAQYVRMAGGAQLTEIPKPYRYRVLTPWLARLVPGPPQRLEKIFEITADKRIAFRFGVVNLCFMAAAATFLWALLRSWHFGFHEALLGGLLLLTAFFVVNYAFVPLVDASSYAFLTLALLASVRRRGAWLLAALALGAFAKETVFLALPLIALIQRERRVVRHQLLLCLPGVLAYALFRLVLFPTETGYGYGPETLLRNLSGLASERRLLWLLVDGSLSYGALWLLALLGWPSLRTDAGHPLARAVWIVPPLLLLPLLLGSNIGRVWFLGFPVLVPLALLGLRRVAGWEPAAEAERAALEDARPAPARAGGVELA